MSSNEAEHPKTCCAQSEPNIDQPRDRMNAVDSNRLKIWQALSEFFLDTEVEQAAFNHVAKTIEESGYTLTEVHSILWFEVFPVLQGNLKSVAGEWAGWPDEWLLKYISVRELAPAKPARGWVGDEINRCWEEVLRRLKSAGPVGRR
ncbi:hypothetical protein [Pseudomonas sp. LS-2]|uniref:DUF7079 family protein n=1 Tax=Pseudomonas sp. LS-2 TaxID=2315859 RepID=UPI002113DC5A|nr:hypothetical protein [Pseudomonas sp. LS-2]